MEWSKLKVSDTICIICRAEDELQWRHWKRNVWGKHNHTASDPHACCWADAVVVCFNQQSNQHHAQKQLRITIRKKWQFHNWQSQQQSRSLVQPHSKLLWIPTTSIELEFLVKQTLRHPTQQRCHILATYLVKTPRGNLASWPRARVAVSRLIGAKNPVRANKTAQCWPFHVTCRQQPGKLNSLLKSERPFWDPQPVPRSFPYRRQARSKPSLKRTKRS